MSDSPLTATSTPPADEPAEELADRVSKAVAACPSVDSLSGGRFGEVATYLPGRRIAGVRMSDRSVEVHVVAAWGFPMPMVAEQVRAACAALAGDRRIDVTIDDVHDPTAPVPDPAPSAG